MSGPSLNAWDSASNSYTASEPMRTVWQAAFHAAALAAALCAPGFSFGQQLVGLHAQRGSGIMQTCDTSMHVDFSTTLLDGYACQFTPQVVPGITQVTSSIWHYYDGSAWLTAQGSPTIPYFGPEPYPMCLSVDAYDPETAQPCSTTVCKVVAPVPYALCAALTANFSIGAVQGNSITFLNQSLFVGGQLAGAFWSFGDGSAIASSPTPTHEFSGPGPFQVCLTVVGAPPTNCTATLCQWLYMGPGNLPCDQLVNQGFITLEYNELVGVIDTSTVSGMNARIDWDFGDGALATGNVVVHAYQPFQTYSLCGTLRTWGPLLSDTCVSTICREVYPMAAVSVPEPGVRDSLLAWPSPFIDAVSIAPLPTGGDLAITDGQGRVVLTLRMPASPQAMPVPLPSLQPGCYLLQLDSGGVRRAQRIVKAP